MNDRIKNMAPQFWEMTDHGLQFNQMRFGEAIIEECLKQCYYRGMNDELYEGQLRAASYIEEYFGVENARTN